MNELPNRSLIVAVIGVDGAGKSSQVTALRGLLQASSRRLVELPNENLQELWARLGQVAGRVADIEEFFGVDVVQLLASTLKWNAMVKAWGSVTANSVVLADRYSYCQLALARRADPKIYAAIAQLYVDFPTPDLCIWLDVPAEIALERLRGRGETYRSLEFIQAHRDGYSVLAQDHAFARVDAAQSQEAVTADIVRLLRQRLPELFEPFGGSFDVHQGVG